MEAPRSLRSRQLRKVRPPVRSSSEQEREIEKREERRRERNRKEEKRLPMAGKDWVGVQEEKGGIIYRCGDVWNEMVGS